MVHYLIKRLNKLGRGYHQDDDKQFDHQANDFYGHGTVY